MKQAVIINTCMTYLHLSFCLSAQLFQTLQYLNIWISISFHAILASAQKKCLAVHSLLPCKIHFASELRANTEIGGFREQSIRDCITSEEAGGLKYLWRAPWSLLQTDPQQSAQRKELFCTNSLAIFYICIIKQMLIHRASDCVRQEY